MQQPDSSTAEITITIRGGRVEIAGMESNAPSVPPSHDGRMCYSVAEVAQRIGCHRSTVHELIQRGDIPARKMLSKTVIYHADLDEYLRSLPRVRA